MQKSSTATVGRFAPTPSGPLHFGSLVAAVGSYLSAKSAGGQWLLRIDDLDPPREVAGAADDIITSIEAHGLAWDGAITYQSKRREAYQAALDRLFEKRLLYRCTCSRKSLPEGIYPGYCREGDFDPQLPSALRLKVSGEITYTDKVFGLQRCQLEQDVGDFIVYRKDELFAYHLAVVVDDIDAKVTEVVRGYDLLSSTPHHIYLYQCLAKQPPTYAHLPLAVDAEGRKLSKEFAAAPLSATPANENLFRSLQFLQLQPPQQLIHESPEAQLHWATQRWQWQNMPAVKSLPSKGIT